MTPTMGRDSAPADLPSPPSGRGVPKAVYVGPWLNYLVWLAMIFIGALSLWVTAPVEIIVSLLAWSLVGMTYLGVGAVVIRRQALRARSRADAKPIPLNRFEGWFRGAAPVLASAIGLSASLNVIVGDETDEALELGIRAVGVVAMLVSWLLLHVSRARHYEWVYRHSGNTGLEFPSESEPRTLDFLYFAITLGTTFATSDVNVTTQRMRWYVISHSVVGFFYNAVVLAVAFKFITGG